MKQQRNQMSHRNPFLSHESPNMFLLDYRRDMQYSERTPVSPQTIVPNNNLPPLNAISQLKQTKLHSSKLDYLIQPEDELGPKSRIITMFSDANGNIHSHDEAANVLQRYSSNQIAFIGIWGSKDSDKAFFYDRIIDLCDVKESKYSKAAENTDETALIYFYERPFVKNNIRIFLLDCRGYEDGEHLSKQEKTQLDILMALCQIIILTESTTAVQPNIRPKDIIETGYDHFNDSFKRLYLDKNLKDLQVKEISWPMSLMILFDSSKSIKAHQNSNAFEEELQKMFQDYNFSVLHNKNRVSQNEIKSYTTINNPLDELYSKNSSTIFKDMYEKIHRKVYMGMKFTGFTCPHILTQLSNSVNKYGTLCFPQAYEKAKTSTYSSLYNRQAIAYLIKLKPYLNEQKSYSTDHLLIAFSESRQETLQQYDDCHSDISVGNLNDELYHAYEQKLDAYIDEKQKNIINVNYKKSMKKLGSSRSPIIDRNEDVYAEYEKLVENQVEDRNYCDANADALTAGNVLKTLYRVKIEPVVDVQTQLIQDKKHLIMRKQQQKQSVLKTRIKILEDHHQKKEKQKLDLIKRSKYFSEQIRKAEITIENLRKQLDNSVHSEQKLEREIKIKENKEIARSLQMRLQKKKQMLKVEQNESKKKTKKETDLLQKLQNTVNNLKTLQNSLKDVKINKTKRFAQIRRIEENIRIRRTYRE